jgi:hypothetical protein
VIRISATPLRTLERVAASVALAALVLLPVLHAPHPAIGDGTAFEQATTIDVGAEGIAPSCSLCALGAQARTAAPAAPGVAIAAPPAERSPVAPAVAEHSPEPCLRGAAAPRAPPA